MTRYTALRETKEKVDGALRSVNVRIPSVTIRSAAAAYAHYPINQRWKKLKTTTRNILGDDEDDVWWQVDDPILPERIKLCLNEVPESEDPVGIGVMAKLLRQHDGVDGSPYSDFLKRADEFYISPG